MQLGFCSVRYVCMQKAKQICNQWYLWNPAESAPLATQSSVHLICKKSLVALWGCGNAEIRTKQYSIAVVKKKKRIISLFHWWGFLSQNRFLFSVSSYCANEIAVTKAFLVTGKLCCKQMLKGNYYLKDKVGRNFPICKIHSPSQIQRLYITQ